MRIVVKRAGQMPKVREVENDLHVFQEIVEGHIECVTVIDDILCVCNDEGKLMGLAPNIVVHGDLIMGNVFFCSYSGEDFAGLSDDQLNFIMNAMYILEIEKLF